MKELIDRAWLLALLKKCKPGIEKNKVSLEGTDCFIFKKGRLHTYNGYISVSVPFPYEFECAVPADELVRVLSSFRASSIQIDKEENALILHCGRAKASINFMSESIYKQILSIMPEEHAWSTLPEGFLDALRHCQMRNALVASSEKIDGIFIDRNGVFSTDKIVVNYVKFYESMARIWLTSKMTAELIKYDSIDDYALQDSWATFRSGDTIFACRRYIDDRYPIDRLRQVVAQHKTDKMSGKLNKEFLTSIENALIFADKKEEHKFISMEFQKDGIQISSKNGNGEYSDFVECPIEDWEHISLMVDGDRLKHALKMEVDITFYIGYVEDTANAFILHKEPWTELFFIYKK